MSSQMKRACAAHPKALQLSSLGDIAISQGVPWMSILRFKGAQHFRQRVVLSTLSSHALIITDIRADDEEPGLRDFEGTFLRLVECLTNGCQIEINETGTVLRYRPGIITGGRQSFDCGSGRSIGWFVEGIVPLAVFAKEPIHVELSGLTNDTLDVSIDTMRAVTLPLLTHFGVEGAAIQVKRRGLPPGGGGLVEFSCPIVRELRALNLVDPGLIKRVRGVAYCAKISPQFSNRLVASARQLLNRLLPDVYIHTDRYKAGLGGASPGYGVSMVAESTTACLLAIDVHAEDGEVPEDVGDRASRLLLEEVMRGGCVDSTAQSLMLTMMALGPEDVGRLRTGPLTMYTMQSLRLIKDVLGVTFKIRADPKDGTVVLSCLGVGFKNLNRKVS